MGRVCYALSGKCWKSSSHSTVSCVFLMLGEFIQRMWLSVDPCVGLRQLESPHTLPCAWNIRSAPIPTVRAIFKVIPLKSNVLLDHLDRICGWTQLRPLYKLLRVWQPSVETSSCGCPRQAWSISSLANESFHLPIWNDLPLSSLSPCPLGSLANLWTSMWTGIVDYTLHRNTEMLQKSIIVPVNFNHFLQKMPTLMKKNSYT